ncbi:hypothetical protein ACSYDW_06000 [Paeniglutamicibacter sp. R2-26]|uniref:hypothetical protein n=1 Tax=Paeniglutamicibacter sp. R2-26 TaxID=3144417 RepID=UPI003EE81E50
MSISSRPYIVENNHDCDGTVKSLRGQVVSFTGKTFYRGEHRQRDDVMHDIRFRGGFPQKGKSNRRTTLLILGGLHPDVVVDKANVRSQTLINIDKQAAQGNHICIVDHAGYELLVNNRPAPCLQHRRSANSGL